MELFNEKKSCSNAYVVFVANRNPLKQNSSKNQSTAALGDSNE